jgi:cytochrome P450 family 628
VNTSAALTAVCFYLATSPQTLSRLQEEVTPLVDSGVFDMRKSLPVLDSVISESLRLQALIPSGEERMTPASGLLIGNDTWIPGKLVVRVPNFAICRDERYFVRPDEFIPERWTTHKELIIDETVAQPFGLGMYECAGKELGMMEIRAAVASLAAAYTWRLDDRVDRGAWEFSGKDHFAMAFESLHVVFEKMKKNGKGDGQRGE